jgi:hypothetical protein
MELPNHPTATHETKPAPSNKSLGFLVKKYFWQLILFFIIAITSGVLLADHEAKSPSSWAVYTSKDAGISFKYPKFYKVVEDRGWRITVYTSPENTENNIKIIYAHTNPSEANESADAQFLANCQPAQVNTVDANGTPIKIYENNTCGGQTIDTAVIVNAENGMDYDISLFGKTDKAVLYPFLATFLFSTATALPLPSITLPQAIPSHAVPSVTPLISCRPRPACLDETPRCMIAETADMCPPAKPTDTSEQVMCTMDAKQCPNGSWVGRTGPHCEFVCPNPKK